MTRLGIGWGTLHHHATVLEQQRLVRIENAGRRRLVFPTGQAGPVVAAEARGMIYTGPARKIAFALRELPGQSILELSERTGDSPRAVYYHVKRLIEAGLLRSSSSTRHADLEPTPLLLALVVDAPAEDRA